MIDFEHIRPRIHTKTVILMSDGRPAPPLPPNPPPVRIINEDLDADSMLFGVLSGLVFLGALALGIGIGASIA